MTDILDIETELEDRPDRDDATFDMFGAPEIVAAPDAGYTVLARKYRPRNFDDLIGQEGMVRTLKNAFASGRIAHAFMLTGVRGVGKTTTARLLARALNYESDSVHQPSVADLAVEGLHCKAIIEGRHLDVLEVDAASRTGIGEMKELLDGVNYAPANARFKVYVIDEIHMLSDKAFNALLKTLEEPPPHAKFIFATTEIRKVPVTILSRCQRFDLRRVEPEVIVANLAAISRAEGVTIDDDALMLIARAAEGSVRDAQSLLDQAMVQVDAGDEVGADLVRDMLGLADRAQSIALFEMIARGDASSAIPAFRALYAVGADPATVMLDLLEHCHAASVARTIGPQALTLPRDQAARLTELGASLSAGSLSRLWQMLLKGLDEVRRAPDPAAAVDMLLIRLAYAADLPGPEEALKAMREGGPGLGSPDPRPPARSAQIGGGGTSAARAPLPQLSAPPSPSASAMPSPATFEEVVALAGEKRDIGLKLDLEKYVRLISFRPGAIEIEATPGAPSNLTQRLVTRLKEWTGQPWLVAYKSGGGADTLLERQKRAHEASHAEALAEPFIQALLNAFPGAEVVDVRQIAAPEIAASDDGDTTNPDD
jgi:DNA polymerase-3 subunit gamma/tau